MKTKIQILIACSVFYLPSCTIRNFTETEYNVLNTLYEVTGKENSPLVGFIPQQMKDKSQQSQDYISDVKIFVGKYPECLVENGNVRGYTLNLDPIKSPCVGDTVSYHKFRWVELTSLKGMKIYYLLSEKMNEDSLYERSKIFYFSDSSKTFKLENGGYHFNREVRVYKGMRSGKVSTSKNAKEYYIINVMNEGDTSRYIHKVVSRKANKISGTKPLVFNVPEMLFEDTTKKGIKLIYNDSSSKQTLRMIRGEKYRMKN